MLETEEGELPVERPREASRASGENGRDARAGETALVDRRGRPIQKPSIRRVLRRAALVGPVLAFFVYWTGRESLETAQIVTQVLVLLAFFIPFSYVVDTFVYRTLVRRHARDREARRRSG